MNINNKMVTKPKGKNIPHDIVAKPNFDDSIISDIGMESITDFGWESFSASANEHRFTSIVHDESSDGIRAFPRMKSLGDVGSPRLPRRQCSGEESSTVSKKSTRVAPYSVLSDGRLNYMRQFILMRRDGEKQVEEKAQIRSFHAPIIKSDRQKQRALLDPAGSECNSQSLDLLDNLLEEENAENERIHASARVMASIMSKNKNDRRLSPPPKSGYLPPKLPTRIRADSASLPHL